MSHYDLIVGTFGTPYLFTLRFTPPSSTSSKGTLEILKQHDGLGSHSWLHLSPPTASGRRNLYATAWTKDSLVAAYEVRSPTDIQLLNTASTKSRSGYICASSTHAYSAGGATGEVFTLDPETGHYRSPEATINGVTANDNSHNHPQKTAQPLQTLDFVDTSGQRDDGSTMDFGGLRHGAHSADLSPDGKLLYIADIGRNCIWTYAINSDSSAPNNLSLAEKKISPRKNDGPRHVWPHPNGKYVYCLQEHTSMVDVFAVTHNNEKNTVKLIHTQGVRIIPPKLPANAFWADEVRTSLSNGLSPHYLYASTRGLTSNTKGYVAVYALTPEGLISGAEILSLAESTEDVDAQTTDQNGLLSLFETATSGGWANAIQPGPTVDGVEYIAMTDSEVGYVFVLGWDGKCIREVGRVDLNVGTQTVGETRHGAATAVWL